ncbi:MAG: 3-deoxy-D-manno-octulosonic acid transferase [Cyanobacteria bacterium SIG28]|nr:3-deoxy-D-manno-octulosonic acid transferase [Cyanobacteria bacterium SIG28]
MIEFLSNLMFKAIKPIATRIILKKGYPQDAVNRKCGIIPEEGFQEKDNVIMFHGVSVGETNALENLIKQARQEFPSSKLVYTTGTYTGQELAKKKFSDTVDLITYFPADFPCVIKKFLDKVNPSVVMIAETEIWPFFARECKKRGIKLYIINGRISDSTFKSYNAFKFIFKYFLSFYAGIFTQSEDDNNKFLALGANPQTTKKMSNLKFDIKKPDININFVKSNNRIFLAGSTHSGEDEIVLNCFKQLKQKHPDLKMILAPRHLTRTEEVKALIEKYGFDYALRSEGKTDLDGIAVLLLDTLGELGKMYNFADVSFIGGSFNKTGGHNPLESIVFNKPVISGPSIHNFKDIYSIIKKADAGFVVENEQELYNISDKLFSDSDYYKNIIDNCKNVFAEQQGALQFVINILNK